MVDSKMIIKEQYLDIVQTLYENLKKKSNELLITGLDKKNFIILTDLAMKEVGKIKDLVGFEKKALVLATMHKFVDDTVETAKKQSKVLSQEIIELKVMVDNTLDTFIDQLFSLAPKVYGQGKKKCLFMRCC